MEITQIESLCDAKRHTESTTNFMVNNFSNNYHATAPCNLSIWAGPSGPHGRCRCKIQSRHGASQATFTAYSHFTLRKVIFWLTRDFLSRTRARTEASPQVKVGDRPQGVAGDCNSLAETHAWFDSRVAHHFHGKRPNITGAAPRGSANSLKTYQ